jgi:basic membrane protein A
MSGRPLLAVAALSLVAAAPGAARQPRVGLVLEVTTVSQTTNPVQYALFAGFQRAIRDLGVQGKVVAPPSPDRFVSTFSYLARQKYDLIVGWGLAEVFGMDTAALRYPRARFAIVDARLEDLPHRPKNVRGTLFRTEQPSYLAGYLAALMEKRRPGPDVIGSVGGLKIPVVDAFIAGFQAGARKADPGITLLNGYSQDFLDPAKCRALANQQIARGAGVVFDVAGHCGLGVLEAAKEEGVWGIGVDIDQSYLGPHILTSVIKRFDVAVYDLVRSLVRGTFTTGADTVFDLRNGGVGLGKVSPMVPQSILVRLQRIKAQIVAGVITVPSMLGR